MSDLLTAREIGAALGLDRRTVWDLLKETPPNGRKDVSGNWTNAWSPESLPPEISTRLKMGMDRIGSKGLAVFSAPAATGFGADARQKAEKLREAFRAPIAERNIRIAPGDLREFGLLHYRRHMGREISGRHWERLFQRIIKDAGARGDFENLNLYFDQRHKQSARAPLGEAAFNLHSIQLIEDALEWWRKIESPGEIETARLLHGAFECLYANGGGTPARREIVSILLRCAPTLAGSFEALRKLVQRKYEQWKRGGCTEASLYDRRRCDSGFERTPDFSSDLQIIKEEAVASDGNLSLAYRQLRLENKLSAEFCQYFPFDVRGDKCRVPRYVRDSISPTLAEAVEIYRGGQRAKAVGPYIPRDPSDVEPGDWFTGDDVTFNFGWYSQEPDGSYRVHRGECLVLIDFRTLYPLDFLLIGGHYNSRHIRRLLTSAHDQLGLPHCGLFFENGIWRANILAGDNSRDAQPLIETESGLSALGLKVRHARPRNPQAKPIERVFGLIQERMRQAPGHLGFNERIDRIEVNQDLKRRVEAGKEDPRNCFFSMEQAAQYISDAFDEWKNEPANGKYNRGVSPAEAWEAALERRPLRKLLPNQRHILSTHCKEVTCTARGGITLRFGKDEFVYYGESTAEFIGQKVLAFFNLDFPELLTFSDLKRERFFSVKRQLLPAFSATREQFAEAKADSKAHLSKLAGEVRVIKGRMKHRIASTLERANQFTPETESFGEFHAHAEAAAREEAKERAEPLRKLREMGITQELKDPAAALAKWEKYQELLNQNSSERKDY